MTRIRNHSNLFSFIGCFGRNCSLPTVKVSVARVIQLLPINARLQVMQFGNDAESTKKVITLVGIWSHKELYN